MKTSIALFLSLILLFSCADKKYFELSDFNIQQNALKDNDSIGLIYFTYDKDYNTEADYYNHFIVVSKSTNDTFNILCAYESDFTGSVSKLGGYAKILVNLKRKNALSATPRN